MATWKAQHNGNACDYRKPIPPSATIWKPQCLGSTNLLKQQHVALLLIHMVVLPLLLVYCLLRIIFTCLILVIVFSMFVALYCL